ncbi:MAG: helix-turn-helix transcriptional regulator [Parafannyhessea sp.]|uniref:helix-turn-helix transcriptional regulator n=1 Tax=Parafannyhessea sp. TaxID=2847324 RepID=UPI003EFBAD2E
MKQHSFHETRASFLVEKNEECCPDHTHAWRLEGRATASVSDGVDNSVEGARHQNNLRACRDAAGLKQPQVAAALGVSGKAVSSWETGRVEMKADHILDLARLLHCTPNDILGYEGESEGVRGRDYEVRATEEEYIRMYVNLAPNVRDALHTMLEATSKVRRPR